MISSLSESELKSLLKRKPDDFISFYKKDLTIKAYVSSTLHDTLQYEIVYFLDNNDYVSEIYSVEQVKSELYKFKVEKLLK